MRYFDSGVLLKLSLPEPNAVQAVALVQATDSSPVVTPLHVLEMRSAIRQKQGRNELTDAECLALLSDFDQDLASGFYIRITPPWDNLFARAETLSSQHTVSTLCRTLDTLHVALALELGAIEFCTFDQRQAAMARLAGLTVVS